MKNYIAIDIGASSGRFIKGILNESNLRIEEIHRFENKMITENESCYWDLDHLVYEVLRGLKLISSTNNEPESIGIDTWGVDYVLIGKDGKPLGNPFSYRDSRTEGMMDEFFKILPKEDVYEKTGIQFAQYNTLFQLLAEIKSQTEEFGKAVSILMIPDYLNYLLTGIKSNEFTNATTTQLVNVKTGNWDSELLEILDIHNGLLCDPLKPGTVIGPITEHMQNETGLSAIPVIAPATHDTASAVASIPAEGENWAFISSGTWSLMGVEIQEAICSDLALHYNFTNEGGINESFQLLKNLTGLWMVNKLRAPLKGLYSYEEICQMAYESVPFSAFIDVNDPLFFNPDSMYEAIDDYCFQSGQKPPVSVGAYVRCAIEGLAFLYRETLEQLRYISPKPINHIHIIGGGCQNTLLCQMTANATNLPVMAGPVEGTAIGNIIVQALTIGQIKDLKTARKLVADSFEIVEYLPQEASSWDKAWESYAKVRKNRLDNIVLKNV